MKDKQHYHMSHSISQLTVLFLTILVSCRRETVCIDPEWAPTNNTQIDMNLFSTNIPIVSMYGKFGVKMTHDHNVTNGVVNWYLDGRMEQNGLISPKPRNVSREEWEGLMNRLQLSGMLTVDYVRMTQKIERAASLGWAWETHTESKGGYSIVFRRAFGDNLEYSLTYVDCVDDRLRGIEKDIKIKEWESFQTGNKILMETLFSSLTGENGRGERAIKARQGSTRNNQ